MQVWGYSSGAVAVTKEGPEQIMAKSVPPPAIPPGKDPYLGAVINDHITLGRLLGEGGMSRVYATVPRPNFPDRAVKLLRHDLLKSEEAIRRFRREAAIMMELDSPNILPVYESGVAELPPFGGEPFIVTRLVRGKTMDEMLGEMESAGVPGRMRLEDAVTLISKVCAALMAAHEHKDAAGNDRPIIHRDLKPSNVFVETHPGETRVLLADFGISCFKDPQVMKATLSDTNLVVGTPSYMAPEQALLQPLDEKADVYALGVMTYELLSGRLPLEPEEDLNTQIFLARLMSERPKPLKHLMPGVSDPLDDLVMSCLAKDPVDRPTVREFRDRLSQATGAQINRSFRPPAGPPDVSAYGKTAPLGSVTTGIEPVPLLAAASKPNGQDFEAARTSDWQRPQRDVSTDPPPDLPMRGASAWLVVMLSGALLFAAGLFIHTVVSRGDSDASGSSGVTASGEDPPARERQPLASVDAGRADAATAALPRGVEPPPPVVRVAPVVARAPPPDPRISQARTNCLTQIARREDRRDPGWRDGCRTYVAARCRPDAGGRAMDCELIEIMLQRAAASDRRREERRRRAAEEEADDDANEDETGSAEPPPPP